MDPQAEQARYKVFDNGQALCPWVLERDGRHIAHFTTQDRAIDYRDYLIARKEG
jgi:hypothetical protein